MTSTAKARACPTPTARQKQVWDKAARGYDKQIAFFEKIQFAGGREWLGARARGRVLEVAIGTGRSLPHYPADASITGMYDTPAVKTPVSPFRTAAPTRCTLSMAETARAYASCT